MTKHLVFIVLFNLVFISVFGQIVSEWDSSRIAKEDSLRALWNKKSSFFPRIKYDKVIGYSFNKGVIEESEDLETSVFVDSTRKFTRSIYYKSAPLTKEQIVDLLKIINDTTTYQWGESGCFVPHNGFVFFYKGWVVAYINIGKNCSQITANPWTPIMRDGGISPEGMVRFRKYYKKIGLPNY